MSDTSSPDAGKASGADGGRVDPKLLEILVCPLTKTRLEYDAAAQELISRAAGLAFPITDGVPRMRLSDARELGDQQSRR